MKRVVDSTDIVKLDFNPAPLKHRLKKIQSQLTTQKKPLQKLERFIVFKKTTSSLILTFGIQVPFFAITSRTQRNICKIIIQCFTISIFVRTL